MTGHEFNPSEGTCQSRAQTAVDVAGFRACQRKLDLRPYEALMAHDRWTPRTPAIAHDVMTRGWVERDFPPVNLTTPIDWASACEGDRSWHFLLHSWDPLAQVLAAYDHDPDPEYLRFAVDVARDWTHQHGRLDVDVPFAWYDMAIGLRAYRLAYILDAAARRDEFPDDVLRDLIASALLHGKAFDDEGNFASHSNHGFFFAAGELAFSRRLSCVPGMQKHTNRGSERIQRLLSTQFIIEEGTHREHSTYYHWMVQETFDGLIQAGLLDREMWGAQSHRIQDSLSWFILPNGRMAMFGDTPHRPMIRPDRVPPSSSPNWVFTTTGGRSGRPPTHIWRAFPSSGYVVFRDGWPKDPSEFEDWTYLAQICAFHSRVHKHADDLSFVWYDHGQEILVDAGRFGYLDPCGPDSDLGRAGFYYSNPKRVYVESTRAHNTVEIDGRSYQRRGVKPYGSALRDAGEFGGVFYSVASVRQFRTIRHRRALLLRPREWLLVMDWLHDNAGEPHSFAQRFHFAPELTVALADNVVTAHLKNGAPALHMTPLLAGDLLPLERGREYPDYLGWVSRKDGELLPCWTGGTTVDGCSSHTFATLFTFDDEAPVPGASSVKSNTGRMGAFRWQQGPCSHLVTMKLSDKEELTLDYRMGCDDAA